MSFIPIHERCAGKWQGILCAVGVPAQWLNKRNQSCPWCGGRDRFRWTDHKGGGGFICNHCGHGSGVDFVMKFLNVDFKEALQRIEPVIDNSPVSFQRDDVKIRDAMRRVWNQGIPVTRDCAAGRWLANRGIEITSYPRCLRFVGALPHRDGVEAPAMLAQILAPDGVAVNIHRTWLTNDGYKASVDPVRMVMQGNVPAGSAVRLMPCGARLGIGEGIETCYRAAQRFEVPVWSCLNAGNLAGFRAPDGVEELVIFADNDANYVGQSAAYECARQNVAMAEREKRNLTVRVMVPEGVGKDYADNMP